MNHFCLFLLSTITLTTCQSVKKVSIKKCCPLDEFLDSTTSACVPMTTEPINKDKKVLPEKLLQWSSKDSYVFVKHVK